MLIVQIIGGIGNQMFQYATGRALSIASGQPLRIDTSAFDSYRLHQGFELHRVFGCNTSIVTPEELRAVLGWQATPLVKRALSRPLLSSIRSKALVIEPHFHYWSGLHAYRPKAYLQGYWQSEKYFSVAAAAIRSDFTFRIPLSAVNAAIVERIEACGDAVSLHVRRGDYVSNSRANATHGICSLDYYYAAVSHIASRITKPEFFIFSDDMDWVRNNLKLDYPCHFIDHNHGAESFNDMRLMSICKHHIIANSSFSWWGAWLNRRADKIVIAPKKWFAINLNVKDLLPAGWVVL